VYELHADGVIATKRIWAAKPLLVAYVVAVGFTVGLLVNRTPGSGQAVAVFGGVQGRQQHASVLEPEREPPEAPLWLQLFRPSQPTARLMLRMGLPLLSVTDGSAAELQHRKLVPYLTGRAEDQPRTFFQTILPFLGPQQPKVATEPGPAPLPPPTAGDMDKVPLPDTTGPPDEQSPDTPAKPPATPAPAPALINGGRPLVGIYHTHDWESYISEFPAMAAPKSGSDLQKIESENHKKKTVMEIGKTVAQRLKELGVATVYADATHQSLGYDYAYKASRETAAQILKEHPSVQILMDLHRDGTWGVDTTAVISGKRVAQIRCIIGSNQQPHWQQNKEFCGELISRLEKKYPGLTLPTKVQNDRYNQDLLPGAILLEIGDAMNNYDEAERSALYLADGLAAIAHDGAYPHQ
jgi:stage II sporulation protein P